MYKVVNYEGLESKTFNAANIPITFKKGEKLELSLGRADGKLRIEVTTPTNSVYVLQQYLSEEKAKTDFRKYLEKLESGKYALHIKDQLTAELVPRKSYTSNISQTIRGNNF
jgi:hypothetical protein